MTIAVRRNSSGMICVCQSGLICTPITTISVPSEDWCIIGRTVPSATRKNSTLLSFLFALTMPHFSKKAGENSSHMTTM